MDENFRLLEDRIRRAAARLRELQAESDGLRAELSTARARAEEAERRLRGGGAGDGGGAAAKVETVSRELQGLLREREEIRSRISRVLELLEAFE